MASIGTFTYENGVYVGVIETLSCAPAPVRFEPVTVKPTALSPDYRVFRGASEIGGAWGRFTKSKRRYLAVTLDDPAFNGPIECRLVGRNDGFVLMWSR